MKSLKEALVHKHMDHSNLKYKITNKTTKYDDHILYQIMALKDIRTVIGIVHEGDLGGWIESYRNLDQKGDCWVADNAKVYENAQISENALVGDCGSVWGNSKIYGDAIVSGYARICRDAKIYGKARVSDTASVHGTVCGTAEVYGDAQVWGMMSKGTINKGICK